MSFEAFKKLQRSSFKSPRSSGSLSIMANRLCLQPGMAGMSFTTSREGSFDSVDSTFDPDDLLTEMRPESERLQRLHEIQPAFCKEGEEPYDSVVKLIRSVFHVPIVLVSLVYDEFQWFKSGVGLDCNQTPRCQSFCAYTFLPSHPQVLYVPDAREDPRFQDNPLVLGPPYIRFYCGVPLITQDDVRLGALCMIEDQPRSLDSKGMQLLINLAELTVRELLKSEVGQQTYLDRLNERLKQPVLQLSNLERSHLIRELWFKHGSEEAVLIVDASDARCPLLWANELWNNTCRCTAMQSLWSLLEPDGGMSGEVIQKSILDQLNSNSHISFSARLKAPRDSTSEGLESRTNKFSCKVCFAEEMITKATQLIKLSETRSPASATPIEMAGGTLLVIRIIRASHKISGVINGTVRDGTVQESLAPNFHIQEPPAHHSEPEPMQPSVYAAALIETFESLDRAGHGEMDKDLFLRATDVLCLDRQKVVAILKALEMEKGGNVNYKAFAKWVFKVE